MSREGALVVMLLVAVLLLGLAGLGWWRRTRRDRDLVVPAEQAPSGSAVRRRFSGLYVATTVHDAALERLAVRGLGYRAKADLTVTDDGLVLDLQGQEPIFISRARLTAAEQATVAIDRVVERDGLARFSWRIDDATVVDSYFRPQGTSARAATEAIASLLISTTPTGNDA
ncbi:MAG: hypothetical protein K0R60_1391 [Microbacterium sp.]|jgi:hypothetical protein|nr:hypothetical protein [Microbacterium sp.]MDF2555496.1 hypothetical protein [Microbacterium sp.]